jgi:glycosyltransferase involved in cell wall biosynthesis
MVIYVDTRLSAQMKDSSSDLPSVTIITVCKNAAHDLICTGQSVLNQTFTNIQYIIQDGVSDDDITLSYLYSLQDSRVSVFSESDSGIYDAMNRAIEKAHGKWCIFLNAGDYFRSNESLARIVTEAETEIEIDLFVFANYNEFDKTIKTYPKRISRYFLYRNGINHQGQLWKTDVIKKYLPFDLNYKIEDRELGHVNIKIDEKSITVIYNESMTEGQNAIVKRDWYAFLKELRMFAKSNMLTFDTRDITKIPINIIPKLICNLFMIIYLQLTI